MDHVQGMTNKEVVAAISCLTEMPISDEKKIRAIKILLEED